MPARRQGRNEHRPLVAKAADNSAARRALDAQPAESQNARSERTPSREDLR